MQPGVYKVKYLKKKTVVPCLVNRYFIIMFFNNLSLFVMVLRLFIYLFFSIFYNFLHKQNQYFRFDLFVIPKPNKNG